jgi:hypothetical protein
MRNQLITCAFSFALLSSATAHDDTTNKVVIPEFKTAVPESLLPAQNAALQNFNFRKAKSFHFPWEIEIVDSRASTCYTMRSYQFDNSEMPKLTGKIDCTDSKLAQRREIEANTAPSGK